MIATMKRREFITLLGGVAAWPLAARAQEAGRTYRLGFLLPSARQTPVVEAFFDELRLNGFIEGKNLAVVPGGFESTDDNLADRAAALVRATPDAIIASPCGPLARPSGRHPDDPAHRHVRRYGRRGIGDIARASRRQHHRHQSALPRTRRQTPGYFDRGCAQRAPHRGDGRFQANPAISPSGPGARGALARRRAFGFPRQRSRG